MRVCDFCHVECEPLKKNMGSMKIDACCRDHKKRVYARLTMIKRIEDGKIDTLSVQTIKKHGFDVTVKRI